LTFFAVNWILVFKHSWIKKSFNCLRWNGYNQQFPNFFRAAHEKKIVSVVFGSSLSY